MTVGVPSYGRAYAYCNECGEFDTRDSREAAQRWLELHSTLPMRALAAPRVPTRAQPNAIARRTRRVPIPPTSYNDAHGDALMTIRTACPSCGATLSLDPDDVVLASWPEPPATYTISCPDCGAVSVKRADSLAEWLLRTAGVVAIPAAPLNPLWLPGSPPLSLDDLLDLHLLLDDEERSTRSSSAQDIPRGGRSLDAPSTLDRRAAPGLTWNIRS
jgi:predicted RNA-binding Zn-ribbon protein involved in translation (DUF1610 family)